MMMSTLMNKKVSEVIGMKGVCRHAYNIHKKATGRKDIMDKYNER